MKKPKDEMEEILENVAEAVAAFKTTPPTLDDDPFDFYVKRVQYSVFSQKEPFIKHFVEGYHILLRNL